MSPETRKIQGKKKSNDSLLTANLKCREHMVIKTAGNFFSEWSQGGHASLILGGNYTLGEKAAAETPVQI